MRTTRASRGTASPTASAAASAGQKLDATNGKLPPSGKATASATRRPQRAGRQRHRPPARAVQPPGGGRQGHEGAGHRAGEARERGQGAGPARAAPRAAASTAAEPDGDAQREGQPPGDRASWPSPRRTTAPRRARPSRVAHQALEEPRRRRPRSARRRAAAPSDGRQRREEHAVAGHVMAAVPAVVPQHEAEVGAVVLRGEVRARRGQHEVDAPRRRRPAPTPGSP